MLAALTIGAAGGVAQPPAPGGEVLLPGSSVAKPGAAGVWAHTNTLIFIPNRAASGQPRRRPNAVHSPQVASPGEAPKPNSAR